jgi:NAD(P)H-quinone oxidoreductase subunit 4
LAPVAPRETLPALALAFGVVALGLFPSLLGHLSEATTTAMTPLPVVVAAIAMGGLA